MIQITLTGSCAGIEQALSGVRGVDFGYRCYLSPLPDGQVSLPVFVPASEVSALRQASGPLAVHVLIQRNASAEGRAMQARVMRTLPPGVRRMRGRGGSSADIIDRYAITNLIDAQFRALAEDHPEHCRTMAMPYRSARGTPVPLYRIGVRGPARGGHRGVLITACAYPREWGGAEICLNLASDLLDAYATGTGLAYGSVAYGAAQVSQVLEAVDLFVMPCIDPDGRSDSIEFDPLWHDGPATSVPVSPPLPECRNVAWLLEQFPHIGTVIDIHHYAGDFLHAWNSLVPCDEPATRGMADGFAATVRGVRGSHYHARQSVQSAPASPTGVHRFKLEYGLEPAFQPDWPEMGRIIEEISAGLIAFCFGLAGADTWVEAPLLAAGER